MNSDEPGPATTQVNAKASSKKAEHKRTLILKTARRVYAARGFSSVTMNDIAAACGISRGGLYLYYSSNEAILADVLSQSTAAYESRAERVLARKISARDNLELYLREEAQRCFSDDPQLTGALMEYGLAYRRRSGADQTDAWERCRAAELQFEEQEKRVLQELVRRGVNSQELRACDPEEKAGQIRIFMDGVRIRCLTGVMTEQEIQTETANLVKDLAIDRDHRVQ